jgi:hypothetical protein
MPVMRCILVEHGAFLVDIDGDILTGRMINRDGAESDLFSVIKRGKVANPRLPLPWAPLEYKKPEGSKSVPVALPLDHKVLIPKGAEWQYTYDLPVRGKTWAQIGFNAEGWKTAAAPFGYGNVSFRTDLREMRRKHTVVYARREFQVEQADRITELGLHLDFRDAFIAYVNGGEVARNGVGRSSGRNAQNVKTRDAKGFQYYELANALKYLKDGANVFSIEVHSSSVDRVEFLLDPVLVAED